MCKWAETFGCHHGENLSISETYGGLYQNIPLEIIVNSETCLVYKLLGVCQGYVSLNQGNK